MPQVALIDWPEDTLGCPLRASYRSQFDPRYAVIQVQDGPHRLRLVSDAQKQVINVSFLFSADQLAIYEAFYHSDLISGQEWFNMRLQTGLGLVMHVCHCAQARSVRPEANSMSLFRIEFDIEAYSTGWVMPPPFAPDDPMDGGGPADLPVDIIDGRNVTDPRPADLVNSLTPVVYI